ncbi:MAG: hypothetical protein EHM61_26615 [Acidobacteria bacterium]|nr:MAG: hypothetical protein EHM61_26615 [Acidobacteriota bacterium]
MNRVLLLVLLLSIGLLHGAAIWYPNFEVDEVWFPVLLYVFAVLGLLLRPQAPGVDVFAALLASLSALFLAIANGGPFFFEGAPDWATPLVAFSDSLILLFPFTFVHFSLVFPVVGPWYQHRTRRALLVIYLPLTIVLALYAVAAALGLESAYTVLDGIIFFFIPCGFLLGLGIFIQRYRHSLTTTEKNRIRVIVVGCLVGGVPLILAKIANLPGLAGIALLLLPLFPLSLVLAVLKEDFAEPAPIVQKTLRISMVSAGAVSSFFLASLLLSVAGLTDNLLWILSLVASLIMLVPLVRWSASYVGAHFPFPLPVSYSEAREPGLAFEPISPNPYIVGNPVRSPEMFFGREEDFQFIRSKLEGQGHGCIVLLCGERRAGKTSILYQILGGRLGGDFVPVFLDMQELVVRDDREFVKAFGMRVSKAIKDRVAADLSTPPQDYLELGSFFEQVMTSLGTSRIVLLFDEYELIAEKVREGRVSAELSNYLNALLERHPRLNIVFAGSRPLEADAVFSRLLGKAFYREVSFLALPDAVSLICSPLRGRVTFENDAVSELVALTHGHPFFVQLLCQAVVELLNDLRRNNVTREVVTQVVGRVLDNPPPQLLYKWSGYSDCEKLVLAGLATLLKRPASYVSADRVARLVLSLPPQHRHGLDAVGIRIILEHLRRGSTLDRDQDRYGFTMDLLRRYIKAEHTVWSVLGERRLTADS